MFIRTRIVNSVAKVAQKAETANFFGVFSVFLMFFLNSRALFSAKMSNFAAKYILKPHFLRYISVNDSSLNAYDAYFYS